MHGVDYDRCIKAKRSARADVEGGGNLAGERAGGGHGGWQTCNGGRVLELQIHLGDSSNQHVSRKDVLATFYEKTPEDDSSTEELSGSSQQVGGPIA